MMHGLRELVEVTFILNVLAEGNLRKSRDFGILTWYNKKSPQRLSSSAGMEMTVHP
jgi:hypothetical protein